MLPFLLDVGFWSNLSEVNPDGRRSGEHPFWKTTSDGSKIVLQSCCRRRTHRKWTILWFKLRTMAVIGDVDSASLQTTMQGTSDQRRRRLKIDVNNFSSSFKVNVIYP